MILCIHTSHTKLNFYFKILKRRKKERRREREEKKGERKREYFYITYFVIYYISAFKFSMLFKEN